MVLPLQVWAAGGLRGAVPGPARRYRRPLPDRAGSGLCGALEPLGVKGSEAFTPKGFEGAEHLGCDLPSSTRERVPTTGGY
ncbi:hypothetical protein GCM10011583_53140 [Streptomyces camponoticapitis]|uniref:Uncharacterized protein n=1 Tax=Streptomyces camponoticapitis TaxID=1616125 RepID=A0ABQ2ENY3_9ACTN|nr:hypothetical protein GCM10011583_53140 [Streptomyces camponoticapitis]